MRHADRASVEDFAHALTKAQLQCREMGHNWRPWSVNWVADGRYYERALQCPRCMTERWQTMSETGSVLGGQYRYPEGYQAKGLGRIIQDGRDALRLESLRRELPK